MPNTGDRLTVSLGAVLDAAHGAALHAELDEIMNKPRAVAFSADQVERVDAAGLQVLLAFVQARVGQGRAVEWVSTSAALRQGAALLGLSEVMGLK